MHLVIGALGPLEYALLDQLRMGGEQPCVLCPASFVRTLPAGVKPIVAQPTSIDFGVSGVTYRELLSSVKKITLCENSFSPVSAIEQSARVRMAAEVVEFVRSGGAKEGVTLLSSLLVFGDCGTPVTEQDFQVGQKFSDLYEESWAVTEKVIRGLKDSTPLAILRTAPISAVEGDGSLIEGSPLARLARQIDVASTGIELILSDHPVRYETVERAARALARMKPSESCQVIHLVDEEALSDRELVNWLAERREKDVRELTGSARAISGLLRSQAVASRAIRGWPLHFSRTTAEAQIPDLLDRDELALLENLFTPVDSLGGGIV